MYVYRPSNRCFFSLLGPLWVLARFVTLSVLFVCCQLSCFCETVLWPNKMMTMLVLLLLGLLLCLVLLNNATMLFKKQVKSYSRSCLRRSWFRVKLKILSSTTSNSLHHCFSAANAVTIAGCNRVMGV